ncbi:hypothetical protein TL16_g02758 [Triparma laevis f. inornata]|uniref:Excinuclease ABC subunit B n=1 Tax=Triparma laevis f. inornata TaxID=1714386 RepID=A0A9W6ZXU3_9STRA|nr:hypothetical protein TL16_g02758 [Triparma laevis f. inornata]
MQYKNLTTITYDEEPSQRPVSTPPIYEPPNSSNNPHVVRKNPFKVVSKFVPSGDQPNAIRELVSQLSNPTTKYTTLKGITGSGKSFVMSHTIAQLQKPALILCPTKTLAAQLCRELRSFLPNNAVELFVSYYNYYTPESFIESSNTYIAKKSSVNDEIDSLRHRATRALFTRSDVVVVASVSCIYGLGLPADYLDAARDIQVGARGDINFYKDVLNKMLYSTPEDNWGVKRGEYLLNYQNNTIKVWPPYEVEPVEIAFDQATSTVSNIIRITPTDSAESSKTIDLTSPTLQPSDLKIETLDNYYIYPARHFVTKKSRVEEACVEIEKEMKQQVRKLRNVDYNFEAVDRLKNRVTNDLLLLRETGFCSGVENYSRHLAGRAQGVPPETLLDYLKFSGSGGSANITPGKKAESDWLLLVDESHVTLPQLRAMYHGDRARKMSLVKNGYRLPSAFDNRPLQDSEFWDRIDQAMFISATPGKFERELSPNGGVDMLIRPTNIVDPEIAVRPTKTQLKDLLKEIEERAARGEKTLAMALTKRDAEDMSSYLIEHGAKAAYIHSDLNTVERADALKMLQNNTIDCLVGVNLMREGIDLPQVSLVAIMSADCEGFLRSETALIQMVGRAARNINGNAIFYVDKITRSMQRCLDETERRRSRQIEYNEVNGLEPISTTGSEIKSIFDIFREEANTNSLSQQAEWSRMPKKEVTYAANKPSLDPTITELVHNLPAKPGIYKFYANKEDRFPLYIGKAKDLKKRCKNYLTGKDSRPRINKMMEGVKWVEAVITPSERDALHLEAKMINLLQPAYNVCLKDDTSFPYICASTPKENTQYGGLPTFERVPRKNFKTNPNFDYEYFGPYSSSFEVDKILTNAEVEYSLRKLAFEAKNGEAKEVSRVNYLENFENCKSELFELENKGYVGEGVSAHSPIDLLFDEETNFSRDVVALTPLKKGEVLVKVLQLRKGIYRGSFDYRLSLGAEAGDEEHRYGDAIYKALESHYHDDSKRVSDDYDHKPENVMTQLPLDRESVKILKSLLKKGTTVRAPRKSGTNTKTDKVAMQFAIDNCNAAAEQILEIMPPSMTQRGTTNKQIKERQASLKSMLNLTDVPRVIECFDVSHHAGEDAVCSRVVFKDGRPHKESYRQFNIKSFTGNDDYRSLTEVLKRRFSRVGGEREGEGEGKGEVQVEVEEAWQVPDLVLIDGGKGQLKAALKGMEEAGVGVVNGDSGGTGLEVKLCSIAKKNEDVYTYVEDGTRQIVNSEPDEAGVLMLREIRDESHRFAVLNMRRRRKNRMMKS